MPSHALQDRVERLEVEEARTRQRLSDGELAQRRYDAWLAEMQAADRRIQAQIEAMIAENRRNEAEARLRSQEAALRSQELDRRMQETDRQIKELGKQIGGLGDKFGGFAEGMALPSMRRRLGEHFGTTAFAARIQRKIDGRWLELDAVAHSDERNVACVVEVKSRLKDEGIQQLLRALAAFPEFFPEHRGKRLVGILAAVDVPEDLAAKVLAEGLVLARISDDVFELAVPEGFEPRSFPNPR